MHKNLLMFIYINFIIGSAFGQSKWIKSNVISQNKSVAYGNNCFIAVGSRDTIFKSIDGMTWTKHYINIRGVSSLNYLTYTNNFFIAVGQNGLIISSPDGSTWTKGLLAINENLLSVAFGNGLYMVVGENGTTITSSDLIQWEVIQYLPGADTYPNLLFYNGLFEVIVNGGIRHYTTNGKEWTQVGIIPIKGVGNISSIVRGPNAIIAVGSGGTILYGTSLQTSGTTQNLWSVIYKNETFVAVGNKGTIITSLDGKKWVLQASPTVQNLCSVTYGNGVFVAIGDEGVVLTSNADSIYTSSHKRDFSRKSMFYFDSKNRILYIQSSELNNGQDINVLLVNMAGRTIFNVTTKLNSYSKQITLPNCTPGKYILNISSVNDNVLLPIVI